MSTAAGSLGRQGGALTALRAWRIILPGHTPAMSYLFPSPSWLEAASQALNQDDRYAQVAHQWEGECVFQVEDTSTGAPLSWLYFDLWHGKCRRAQAFEPPAQDMPRPGFTISASLKHLLQLPRGQLGPLH